MILTDADQLREALAIALKERDEARAALKGLAERQREACAAFMDEQRWYTSRAALSAPLVTEVEP